MLVGKAGEVGGRAWIAPHVRVLLPPVFATCSSEAHSFRSACPGLGVAVTLPRPLPLRAVWTRLW